jgi:hypothetical protein
MVNQEDQSQAVPVCGDHRLETGKSEAVDDRRGAGGEPDKHRRVWLWGEFYNPYPATPGAQPVNDVTIIEIPSGQLIEATRNNKNQLAHPRGAS